MPRESFSCFACVYIFILPLSEALFLPEANALSILGTVSDFHHQLKYLKPLRRNFLPFSFLSFLQGGQRKVQNDLNILDYIFSLVARITNTNIKIKANRQPNFFPLTLSSCAFQLSTQFYSKQHDTHRVCRLQSYMVEQELSTRWMLGLGFLSTSLWGSIELMMNAKQSF